jgi:ACS family allantoate permease-like MFS transporter
MIGMNTIRYALTHRCIRKCLVLIEYSIIGSALVYAGHSVGARYAGLLLMGIYSAAMPVSMAMISSNVGGFTKKATVSSIYFIMYCAGNIIGPQLFFAKEAPKYQVWTNTRIQLATVN